MNPQDVISEKHLGPYVQEALDELEFLTGDTSTEFGALRAKLGREKPWVISMYRIPHVFTPLTDHRVCRDR